MINDDNLLKLIKILWQDQTFMNWLESNYADQYYWMTATPSDFSDSGRFGS
jgi:hypothetical protein